MDSEKDRAVRIVVPAALAGVAITALTWRAEVGLSWLVLVAIAVPIVWRGLDRRPPTPLAIAWGCAAICAAGCIVWRASSWTPTIAYPTSAFLLSTLPVVVHRRLRWVDLAELPALAAGWLAGGWAGAGEARRALKPIDGRANRRVLGGMLIGLPISAIAAILLSANAQFRSAADTLLGNGSDVVSFVWWSVCGGALCLVGVLALNRIHPGVFAAVRHPAWLGHVAITTQMQSTDSPYRAAEAKTAVERVPRALAPLTWAIVLGQLTLVFGLFVAANLGTFFGGHDLVRAAGTRTYSEHLHDGFGAVTAATVLSVLVVMFGHSAVAAPATAPQRRLLAGLEVLLLVLTAVTLGSCWQRMSIYLDAYGLTHLRLFTLVWQVFALGLLVITLVRAMARTWRLHGACLVTWPVLVALGAGTVNADLVIARANLERLVDAPETATSTGLDEFYLERLSVDAEPALDDPHVPSDLAERLRGQWLLRAEHERSDDWRSARGLGSAL
jgi:hypothetical protein